MVYGMSIILFYLYFYKIKSSISIKVVGMSIIVFCIIKWFINGIFIDLFERKKP